MDEQLKQYRNQIDAIDEQILALINRRAQLAHQVGTVKNQHTHPGDDVIVYRPEREAQILQRLLQLNAGPLSNEAVSVIFRNIVSGCRAMEKALSVAFLGPKGTYSESAARTQFGEFANFIECASIDEVFRSTETGVADYGIVPVENSTEGAVGLTLDLLVDSTLKICGEIALPIHHNLMSENTDLTAIETVLSHAQSSAQCHEWLNRHLPHVKRQAVVSNAEAAALCKNQPQLAAIAGSRAAELFNLHILAPNIEDDARNTTRFLVLARHGTNASGNDKTSFIIGTRNVPGAILSALQPLAKYGVSMSKLESRPAKNGMWEYLFFIDIDGHIQDTPVQQALHEVEQQTSQLKLLGSYPKPIL